MQKSRKIRSIANHRKINQSIQSRVMEIMKLGDKDVLKSYCKHVPYIKEGREKHKNDYKGKERYKNDPRNFWAIRIHYLK